MRCRCRCNDDNDYDSVYIDEDMEPKKKMPRWKKALLITVIVILSIALLLFLLTFVAFPIAFMESLAIERFFMFMNIDMPKAPDFKHPEKYGLEGVINFYITGKNVDKDSEYSEVSIGTWLIKPEANINDTITDEIQVLQTNTKPVLLYFHGVACNRIAPGLSEVMAYQTLRKHFLVIAVDYRDFGDSTPATLSEVAVMHDNVHVYSWVRSHVPIEVPIYVWGHSLGTALSTRMVRQLKEQFGIVPYGLILESGFTTMREEVVENAIGKFFKWLAYFNATVLDPLERHNFHFKTTTNILQVDCPIMIMHAEDDNVIPYYLGKKLYEVARTQRNLAIQGNVTYHQFGSFGYRHVGIIHDKHIPEYIRDRKSVV